MKRFTMLMAIVLVASIATQAQTEISGLTGLYTFNNADDLFANAATGYGTGVMKCDSVMKYNPDVGSADTISLELEGWSVIDGNNGKAIALKAHNWFKIWHGIPANGGGDYVNDFSVVMDVRISDEAGIYSLVEVNPRPKGAGYSSEMEIEALKVGSVDKPWSEEGIPHSTNTLSVDTWYRIAYVAKLGEYIEMYVDGVEWNRVDINILDGRPAPYGADTDPDDAAMKVGGNNETIENNDPPRDGDKDIDLVAIYERTLTEAEVASLGGPGAWLGVKDRAVSKISLNIYPNPAKETLYISGKDLVQVDIISVSGQVVKRVSMNGQNSINISQLSSGMYMVKAVDVNSLVAIEKIIVE